MLCALNIAFASESQDQPDSTEGANSVNASEAENRDLKPGDYVYEQSREAPIQSSKTVEDGIYSIRASENIEKAVDVQGGGTADATNVQLYDANGTAAQRFKFTYYYDDGGYYTIQNVRSGKMLDVANADTKSGANVWIYGANGTRAQRWAVILLRNGLYSIKSLISGNVLDISNGSLRNGANIQMYSPNGTNAQIFKLLNEGNEIAVEEGVYTIHSALTGSKVIDVQYAGRTDGTNVQLYADNDTLAQKFIVKRHSRGGYTLISCASGKVLDVAGASLKNGANVQIWSNNNTDAQRWLFMSLNNGLVYIQSLLNGKVVDLTYASTVNGTNVQIYAKNGTWAQKFLLKKISDYHPVTDGTYTIAVAGNRNLVLDIISADRRQGVNVQLYPYNDTPAQKFNIIQGSDGLYTITNVNSRHRISVSNSSLNNCAAVEQIASNDGRAQRWLVLINSDGSVTFVSSASSKAVDIAYGSMNKFSKIWQYELNGSSAQKFVLYNATYDKSLDERPINYAFISRLGIDVSQFNGIIDWRKVRDSGIGFAFIRASGRYSGSGRIYYDDRFDYNIRNAINNNIATGAYFFTQAINENEAREEARVLLSQVRGYNVSLPLVIDTENYNNGRHTRISVQQRTNVVKAFCQVISSAGYTPMVYASTSWLQNSLYMNQLSEYQVWVAQYYKEVTYKGKYSYWQFTSGGSVNGVPGRVDMNYSYV